MNKKSKIPFVLVALIVLSVIFYLFVKTILWQDFVVVQEENQEDPLLTEE